MSDTIITDGTAKFKMWSLGGGQELYLKTMRLESVYPVGSVYIS